VNSAPQLRPVTWSDARAQADLASLADDNGRRAAELDSVETVAHATVDLVHDLVVRSRDDSIQFTASA